MNLSLKLAACATLAMVLLPVGSAFARDPADPGAQQTICIAQGGAFTVGEDPHSYDCVFEDSTWTCDFSGSTPECDTEEDGADVDTDPFIDD